MPTEQPIPQEFLELYDAERARVLHRRAIAYCSTILGMVAVSWSVTAIDLLFPAAFDGPPDVTSADVLTDTLYTVVYAAALTDFLRHRRSRAEIVRRFQWTVAVAGLIAVGVTPLVMNATWLPGASLDHTPQADFAQGIATLITIFILHFLASVFVALSPREGLIPLLPVLAAFVAWVLLVSSGTPSSNAALLLAAPLSALPGFAWSWWRYRSFAQRFHAGAVLQRYNEISHDLAEARRIHEALFPPPLNHGPLRLAYRYEPMRQIGGDFLFVHAPDDPGDSPLLALLVDVTGHGVTAALAVNRVHDQLQHLARAHADLTPAQLISALNTFTLNTLAPQSIFASAFCLQLFPPPAPDAPARLTWAGAGHPPALLRALDATIHQLDSTAPMLGAFDPSAFTCQQHERHIRPGEVVIAYTDGATEARDPDGRQLGMDGLTQALAEATAPHAQLPASLAAHIARFRHAPTADDLLIVALAPATDPAAPLS